MPVVESSSIRNYSKWALWILMGIMCVIVLIFTEYPEFRHANPNRLHILSEKLYFIPHALGGVLALAIGPLQFSTQLRRRNLALHRLLGKIYVGSVAVAAPTAMLLGNHVSSFLKVGTYVQASLWLITTLAAYQTGRNRHVAVHSQWMIRSYAFTFIFVCSRMRNPLAPDQHVSLNTYTIFLLLLNICALLLPDIFFSWKELTHRRN